MSSIKLTSLNPRFSEVQYAVRGELAIKAEKYVVQLKDHPTSHGLPFDKVVFTNIGNPQQRGLDQEPITFPRQVAALTEWPALAEKVIGLGVFPDDVVERARELEKEIGSIGAYSQSQGASFIRKNVAKFIEERDGYPASADNIFLTGGASAGVSLMISMLISSPKSGLLIPIPQYPLYTASLTQHGGLAIPYYLDESSAWSTSPQSVRAALEKARNEGIEPKALVVINPGNPTGSVLTKEVILELIDLAEKNNLVILADEVYQANIHHPTAQFISFKKLVREANSPVPLVSFHSISKGVTGECGRRGGYFECTNFPEDVLALIYKMISVGLCPPLGGQIGVDCMVRPPKPGSPSYPLWKKETDATHKALAERTKLIAERLNALPGVSCVDSPGALYLFPRIYFTKKAVEKAKEAGKTPDTFYALALLDETGICVVPGDGFGQVEGQNHYRLTCLCAGVEEYVGKLEKFHRGFMAKYAD
ncbi:alanine aminotransferase [Sistotremastrum niveocremeum HHB9708]|uniref:Alanine aminotransferase n=1 Tax=Sistotremastrum niveocremeum HHB9708 TaxID=1314777 RepID=A0A164NSE8_9AGAM|nr:alanine aminotransferase [Sistotremastrum niveocremeum HHB9708]